MKIYFDNVDFRSRNGPSSFGHRLAIELSNMGHTLADIDDYDVAICFIEYSNRFIQNNLYKKPHSLRLDGIWFKEDQFQMNAPIKFAYDHANSVIVQSQFDKQMIDKWFGIRDNVHVIHNGISLNKVTEFGDAVIELREKFEKIFVCSASWHGQKRLKENIRLFNKLRNEKYHNSCLVVMGKNPDHIERSQNIFYTLDQPHEVCLQVFAASDWMIHLAWADHCPNTVIESLSQLTPVICANTGGTKEIVKNNGIVCFDGDYDFSLCDYDSPKELDFGLIDIDLPDIKVDSSYLDIKLVAKEYEKILIDNLNLCHGS